MLTRAVECFSAPALGPAPRRWSQDATLPFQAPVNTGSETVVHVLDRLRLASVWNQGGGTVLTKWTTWLVM